jgi:hypothetical protein
MTRQSINFLLRNHRIYTAVIELQPGRSNIQGSIPGMEKRMFSYP